MPKYPPEVERWRSLVEKYFHAGDVDKALYVIQHESGGNSASIGDAGASLGLFQLNELGLGAGMGVRERLDPETNIKTAAAAVYGGSGWKPWGESNLYEGKPFGALGNAPYSGDKPVPPDNNAWTATDERKHLETVLRAMLAEGAGPKPQDYLRDPTDPSAGYSSQVFESARKAWSMAQDDIRARINDLYKQEQGFVKVGDTYVPATTATKEVRDAADAANAQARADLYNKLGLTEYAQGRQYRADVNAVEQDQFENQIKKANESLAYDRTNIDRAAKDISRSLEGLGESRSRADYVTKTQQAAAPYATTPGKTSFSPADLGGLATAYARLLGLDPGASLINYPTTLNIDPQGMLNQYDQQFGVTGPLPQIPAMLTTPADLVQKTPFLQGPNVPPPQYTPQDFAAADMLTKTNFAGSQGPGPIGYPGAGTSGGQQVPIPEEILRMLEAARAGRLA